MRRLIKIFVSALVLNQLVTAAAMAEDDLSCRAISLTDAASGAPIIGAEDMVLDPDHRRVLISAYDRRAVDRALGEGVLPEREGGIYALPLSMLRSTTSEFRLTSLSASLSSEIDFRPHGIDLWVREDGAHRLFAINRPAVQRDGEIWLEPEVLVLGFGADGLLIEKGPIRDPLACRPNDLALVDGERFFITNDAGFCRGFMHGVEMGLGLRAGYVLFYDGDTYAPRIENLAFPNGIAVAVHPTHGLSLFVAETRAKAISVYNLSAILRAKADAPDDRITLGDGPDNLTVDAQGRVWAGALPGLLEFGLYRSESLGVQQTDSSVYSIAGGVARRRFLGEGDIISGASVALNTGSVIIIGASYDSGIALCDSGER